MVRIIQINRISAVSMKIGAATAPIFGKRNLSCEDPSLLILLQNIIRPLQYHVFNKINMDSQGEFSPSSRYKLRLNSGVYLIRILT